MLEDGKSACRQFDSVPGYRFKSAINRAVLTNSSISNLHWSIAHPRGDVFIWLPYPRVGTACVRDLSAQPRRGRVQRG